MKRASGRYGTLAVAVALVGLGFVCGLLVGHPALVDAEPQPNPYARLTTLGKVLSYIERSYVKPVDQNMLVDAAIKGMVTALDPYCDYHSPQEMAQIRRESQGPFVGVGLELTRRQGRIIIVAPIDGAPGAKAGLKAGDELLEIDGGSVFGMRVRDVVVLLQGEDGSKVKLGVERIGGQRLDFEVTRAPIRFDAVTFKELTPGLGYVRIRAFQAGVSVDVEDAIDTLEQDSGGLKGLVLDVRDNPGGYFLEGVKISDLFLDEGVIVSTRGRGEHQVDIFKASAERTRFEGPVALLINRGSASASEIVAGALGDHGRAVMIGQRTFGKGSVQTMVDMKDGSALKLTTAQYFTPNKRSITTHGIVPDIEVASQPEAKAASGEWFAADAQLRMAHGHLKSMLKVSPDDGEEEARP